MTTFVVFLFLLFSTTFGYISYDGYNVYRIFLDNEKKVDAFKDIEKRFKNLDIFSENGIQKTVDIMVDPAQQEKFLNQLTTKEINYETYIENVGHLIEDPIPYSTRNAGSFNWTSYHTYDVIYEWLDSLPQQYPGIVTNFTAGYSYSGVAIKGVRVVFNSSATRVAFVEGGVHAREWINPATATYILNEFLTSTNAAIRAAADRLIWYFVPMSNPDGYNRTFTVDRMHRKNIQVVEGSNCTGRFGTDLNRNFGFNWMEAGGASSNPCSETFAGTAPFSAPEAQALRDTLEPIGRDLAIFLSFHSYSQLFLFPYGHTTTPLDNYYEQFAIGSMAANALETYAGTRYVVGNTAEAIYLATGSSTDWVKGMYGTPLVYCMELRDTGRYGFLLPPDQIIDTSNEAMLAVITLVEQLFRIDTLGTVNPVPAGATAIKNNSVFFTTAICLLLIYYTKHYFLL